MGYVLGLIPNKKLHDGLNPNYHRPDTTFKLLNLFQNVCFYSNSMVRECGGTSTLVAVEAREGSWSAVPRGSGMTIDWVGDHASLRTGDRYA